MADTDTPSGGDFYDDEPMPMTVFYDEGRNVKRPSIQTLLFRRENDDEEHRPLLQFEQGGDENRSKEANVEERDLFGTWDGVYARCILNILGVIMYVRLGWMVGQAGILLSLLIIFMCSCVTLITSLSLSAICTNGEVKGGGAYYLISRSLGPEFGGAIGVLFTFASGIATSLHVIGFSETIKTVLYENHGFYLTHNGDWDITCYGLITLCFLLMISMIGVEYVTKFGLVLLALLVVSILAIIVGSFVCCYDDDRDRGFVGYGQFVENLGPSFEGENFFSVVSVFFPAVTGIMAGANISGDLKDPQKSLPLGTILSVITTAIIYVILVLILGAVSLRHPVDGKDESGLLNNYLIMNNISVWEPLVLVGLIAAALSSALSCLNGAPRILQALAKDDIIPGIGMFAVGRGPNSEPDRGSILTFIISAIGIVIGDLNIIAKYITNFFLISYAFVNYACFASSMSQAPGWRPSFKYYNKWVAVLGTLGCLAGMFLIDWISALITCIIFVGLYKYLDFSEPEVNWGGSSQAKVYKKTLHNLVKLEKTAEHIKTFRPQFLAFIKDRQEELNSLLFTTKLSGETGVTLCTSIILPDSSSTSPPRLNAVREASISASRVVTSITSIYSNSDVRKLMEAGNKTVEFEDENIFTYTPFATTFRQGARVAIQIAGIGKLRPNIGLLVFPTSWNNHDNNPENSERRVKFVQEYVDIIRDCFDYGLSVGILKGMNTLSPEDKLIGTIDVYWLVEDGGLTALLPHLLRKSSQWKRTKLRFFTRATTGSSSDNGASQEILRLHRLLKKFRIRFKEIKLIEGLHEPLSPQTIQDYQNLNIGESPEEPRTQKYLKLAERIGQESSMSQLVIISLPIPEESLPAPVYLSWLHFLTKRTPRALLIRGNNETVLTHLS